MRIYKNEFGNFCIYGTFMSQDLKVFQASLFSVLAPKGIPLSRTTIFEDRLEDNFVLELPGSSTEYFVKDVKETLEKVVELKKIKEL